MEIIFKFESFNNNSILTTMKNNLLFGMLVLILAACSNTGNKPVAARKDSIEITNDMENAQGQIPSWIGAERVFAMKDPPAHSGTYACITNDSAEYSYHYEELFKNLQSELPKRVIFSGWVYTTVANPNFAVICSLNENQQTRDWKAFPLDSVLTETGKWVEFSSDFYMDYKDINPNMLISVYAWNQSKKPIYIDDLKVTFLY